MKTLHVALLVAFLVFQAESKPNPTAEEDVKAGIKDTDDPERAALQADEKGLKEEPTLFRAALQTCYDWRGYCLPREYFCATGLVFKEEYNSCSEKSNKCCVAPFHG